MKIFELSNAQSSACGFTHRIEVTYADLTTAGAAHTLDLLTYAAGKGIRGGAFKLVSGWVGASVTGLTMKVGHNGATTDDDDSIFAAVELCTANTEILFGDANGAAFATLRTGYFPLDAGIYQAIFTATGANINVCTAGEVHIYLEVVDLSKI